jgi:hypothetical protein
LYNYRCRREWDTSMKLVERDYNFRSLLNCALLIAGLWGATRGSYHAAFRVAVFVVFILCNYTLIVRPELASSPARKSPRRIYHSPALYTLSVLGAYLAYAVINTGWIFWSLLLAGTFGAGFALLLRYREAKRSATFTICSSPRPLGPQPSSPQPVRHRPPRSTCRQACPRSSARRVCQATHLRQSRV